MLRLLVAVALLGCGLVLAAPSGADTSNAVTAVLTSTSVTLDSTLVQGCIRVHLSRTATGAPVQALHVYYRVEHVVPASPPPRDGFVFAPTTVTVDGTTDSAGNGTACFTPTPANFDLGVWRWSVDTVLYADLTIGWATTTAGNTVDQLFEAPPLVVPTVSTTLQSDATTVIVGDTFSVTYTVLYSDGPPLSTLLWRVDFNSAPDYVSASSSVGSCSALEFCDFGTWQPNAPITVSAVMRARAVGTITLEAGDLWPKPGTQWPAQVPATRPATRSITVIPRTADLQLTMSSLPPVVRARRKETVVITVTNAGPHPVLDGLVNIGVKGLRLGSLGAPCAGSGGFCKLPALAAGETLRIPVQLTATIASRAKLIAEVTSEAAADPNPANNTAVAAQLLHKR